MGIKIKIAAWLISLIIISGCSINSPQHVEEMDHSTMNKDMEEMDHANMENEHMSHDEVIRLNDSTGANQLVIPPEIERDNGEEVLYTIRAQKGKTAIFDGTETDTYGYNGSFLGPMLRFEK